MELDQNVERLPVLGPPILSWGKIYLSIFMLEKGETDQAGWIFLKSLWNGFYRSKKLEDLTDFRRLLLEPPLGPQIGICHTGPISLKLTEYSTFNL
jgi:hypothetical protein